jgi:hypothetical protein
MQRAKLPGLSTGARLQQDYLSALWVQYPARSEIDRLATIDI